MRNKLFIMISIISILFMASFQVYASEFIQIPDPHLKSAIVEILKKDDDENITLKEAESIKFLPLSNKNIESLEGLQYFKNLNHLNLDQNKIKDLNPLKALINLQILTLSDNFIQDISPLSNLIQLKDLNLNHNQVKDLSPLKNLLALSYLFLAHNNVTDISDLNHLKELDLFDYSGNHIYDISSVTKLGDLRYGEITGEIIQLPSKSIKKGDRVVINNPVKDESGTVKKIMVENGVYDEVTNQVIWEKVTQSQTLSYTFETVIPYPRYGGFIEFSGTIYVDVVVEQGQAPILSGVEDITISSDKPFNLLQGVTAYDTEDGNLTNQIKVEGEVDILIPGKYELTYSVTDSDDQTAIAHRVITVSQEGTLVNQRPVIQAKNLILKKGEAFNLLEGVTAYDFEDNDLTSKIEVIHNTININEVGSYEVTYQVKDEQGATATLRIEVKVREIPETGFSLFN